MDADSVDVRRWREARRILKQECGAAAFGRWIEPLTLRAMGEGRATIAAPTAFLANWVTRHYADEIAAALTDAGCAVGEVEIAVAANGSGGRGEATVQAAKANGEGATRAPSSSAESAAFAGRPVLETSAPLDRRFTFERFVVGHTNELAHAAARRVAESDETAFNPVFLHGGVGLGKTHLMHAIHWRLAERAPDRKVLYLSAEQFMYRFIQALKQKNTIDFKQEFRSVDVLMVDDVQFIAGKDSTQDEFFHTFNALIDEGKQIVISADRAPGQIDGLEERIKSRLQWGLVVDIHPTDYELRLGILQSKTEIALRRDPSIVMDMKVLDLLAHRIVQNVRVLEGALTRLFAFATLVGREITLDMAQECLADLLRESERKVTIEEIMRKVAEHYNLRQSDMTSARRARAVARPRQIAMYLAKQLTSKSLPEIGKKFGGRDHTTVMHAVKRIESLSKSDVQIAEDVELLRRMLEA